MSDPKSKDGLLSLKVKRIRTRLAASVKTGSLGGYPCPQKTDPTQNGEYCEPTEGQGVTHCTSTDQGL
jgi:hypothetical protein